jgi:hypothetical protein
LPILIGQIIPIGHQAAGRHELPVLVNRRQAIPGRQCDDQVAMNDDAEGARRQILAALAICDRLALLAMFGRHCGFEPTSPNDEFWTRNRHGPHRSPAPQRAPDLIPANPLCCHFG